MNESSFFSERCKEMAQGLKHSYNVSRKIILIIWIIKPLVMQLARAWRVGQAYGFNRTFLKRNFTEKAANWGSVEVFQRKSSTFIKRKKRSLLTFLFSQFQLASQLKSERKEKLKLSSSELCNSIIKWIIYNSLAFLSLLVFISQSISSSCWKGLRFAEAVCKL